MHAPPRHGYWTEKIATKYPGNREAASGTSQRASSSAAMWSHLRAHAMLRRARPSSSRCRVPIDSFQFSREIWYRCYVRSSLHALGHPPGLCIYPYPNDVCASLCVRLRDNLWGWKVSLQPSEKQVGDSTGVCDVETKERWVWAGVGGRRVAHKRNTGTANRGRRSAELIVDLQARNIN